MSCWNEKSIGVQGCCKLMNDIALKIFKQSRLMHSIAIVGLPLMLCGCAVPWMKSDPDKEVNKHNKELRQLLASEKRPKLIGDAAVVSGLAPQQFEAFGVISSLMGTGGEIKSGPQREYVLREMRVLQADNPNAILASNTTAVVKIKANVHAGCQAGELVDLIVEKSTDCDAKDLRNGWLMPTRLLDLVSAGGSIRQSDLKANATGPLVTFPASLNSTKELDRNLAIVLGGGRVTNDQVAYLRLNDAVRHVKTANDVADDINARFDLYFKGELRGVAEGKTDRTIELMIPSKYRLDIGHYTDTVLSIGFLEKDRPEMKAERLKSSEALLSDPITARRAAMQLEAIGKESIPILRKALQSSDKEIRFYAAYSLAYLDDDQAVPTLIDLARTESAFRPMALIGLSVVDRTAGEEGLKSLLSESEPELCYGALRSLRKRKSQASVASGQMLSSIGRVTEIISPNPMIAVSLELEPEIALFGGSIPLSMPNYYEVNSRMTMRAENGMILLSSFKPNEPDQNVYADPNIKSVLEAMSKLQASYSDAIIFLDEAQRQKWITVPVAFNPIAKPGRKFNRLTGSSETEISLAKSDLLQDEDTKPIYPWYSLNRYWTN